MTQVVIDGANLAWRTFVVFRDLEWGMETGFLRSVIGLMRRYNTSSVRVVWDSYCRWRREIYPEYKGSKPRTDFYPIKVVVLNRITSFRSILSWVLPQYSSPGCEADDVISALSFLLAPDNVVIVSSDRDLLQLASVRSIVSRPQKSGYKDWTAEGISQDWGVKHPRDLSWLRSYKGDTSDNLPGCRVPKKLLGACVSGVWADVSDFEAKAKLEQTWIEGKARESLTPGWLRRLLDFKDKALLNHKLMALVPPRVGSYIQCEYHPDFDRFAWWLQNIGADSLIANAVNYFGSRGDRGLLEQPFIPNQWDSYG